MPKASASTQDFVTIKDIKGGVVTLKNGQMCQLLLATSINFALKSTNEQQAILQQFQTFLNTLDFTLQVYVQSRRLNIEPYLQLLKTRESAQDNDLMRIQLREYMEFIRTFTTEVDIMSKSFFVIVPYSPAPVNLTRGVTSFFGDSTTKKDITSVDQRFEEHLSQLEQRVALVIEGLGGIGIKTAPLKTDDLVELFYHINNPIDASGKAPSLSQT